MAFPQTVQDILAELYLAGAWVNITSKVRREDGAGIFITRGRADEQQAISPSTCNMNLNNRDGRFSPRNPSGPYFGQIGRNTPLRVSVVAPTSFLQIDQNTGTTETTAYVSTPDAATLDITGDVDIRFEADFDSWADVMELVTKWGSTTSQRSYALTLTSAGKLALSTSSDGLAVTTQALSDVLPITQGRIAVRATLDVNNGAAGRTATFYTSDSINGTWVQLGDAIVTAGTTTIFSGTEALVVGDAPNATFGGSVIRGKIYAAEVRNGIAGTVVANPDFRIQTAGASSFADTAAVPKTWTLNGKVSINNRDYRFCGEVSSFPQKWDISGTDVWTEIEGAGILRRLNQGEAPVSSTLYRTLFARTDLVAYWPCEDGSDARTMASAVSGGRALWCDGTPEFASDSSFVCSAPVPVFNGSRWHGYIKPYTDTGTVSVRFLLNIPLAGLGGNVTIATLRTAGDVNNWDIIVNSVGNLNVTGTDRSGTQQFTQTIGFALNGRPSYVGVRLVKTGSDTVVTMDVIDIGAQTNLSGGATMAGLLTDRATSLLLNTNSTLQDVGMGHISVQSSINPVFADAAMFSSVLANINETAETRLIRLCAENNIPFFRSGSLGNSAKMGYQGIDTVINLLRECEATDMGILYEDRAGYGLAYRSRNSILNEAAGATANYASNQLAEDPDPVDDDAFVRNDITVRRNNAGSSRAVQLTGPLSTASASATPPGVGVYDEEVPLSLNSDDSCEDQAGWRLHVGTVDEARYPRLGFNLASPSIANSATLREALAALDIGDRLDITNPPAWLPPETIRQVVNGTSETLANYERFITVNCSPYSAWTVGVYGPSNSSVSRYSSDGTTVRTAMTTTQTTMNLTTPFGPLWTTDPAQFSFDLMVAGERMTATACSGSTASTQVFTVVRSVNGVVKTHAIGEAVELFEPAYYSF